MKKSNIMRLEIVGKDKTLSRVVIVRVPGIYPKGKPLPARMAKLTEDAAISLQKVYQQIVEEGGHLYISDMFRTSEMQLKAYQDWKLGRKKGYSPPPGNSMHEAGRAIDIDAFDTGIGHKRVRQILNKYGWRNIVDTLTGSECWHYDFFGEAEKYLKEFGYLATVRRLIAEINNKGNTTIMNQAINEYRNILWVQQALNALPYFNFEPDLPLNGYLDKETKLRVMAFQRMFGLQVDGIPGPITIAKLSEELNKQGIKIKRN